jgi:hypothetical protein
VKARGQNVQLFPAEGTTKGLRMAEPRYRRRRGRASTCCSGPAMARRGMGASTSARPTTVVVGCIATSAGPAANRPAIRGRGGAMDLADSEVTLEGRILPPNGMRKGSDRQKV